MGIYSKKNKTSISAMCVKKKRSGTSGMVSLLYLEIILKEHEGENKIMQIGQPQPSNPGIICASVVEVKDSLKYVSEKNRIASHIDRCESLHLSS